MRRRLQAAALAAAVLFSALPASALPKKGEPAPPLKVTTLAGQELTLASLSGKVVLLDFFATWCPPCADSIPELVELAARYDRQGLRVVGLSLDEDGPKLVREFALQYHIDYPVAMAGDEVVDDYGIRQLPVVYLIDRQGRVAEKILGFSPNHRRMLESAIERLLKQK